MKPKKNNKANLEKKRFIFFQLGIILALSVCLAAFEWSSPDYSTSGLGNFSTSLLLEDEILITKHDDEIPELETKVEPEIEDVFDELIIVDDDKEVDTNPDFDSEDREGRKGIVNITQFDDYKNDEEDIEPLDWVKVEEKPIFPGGDVALLKFISDNTKYPAFAKENGIQGRVFVQFVISQSGKVINVKIARGTDPYLDAEALRIVQNIPDWSPGKQRGKAVPVNYIIPISFRLY